MKDLIAYARKCSLEEFTAFLDADNAWAEDPARIAQIAKERAWLQENETPVVVSKPGCRQRIGYSNVSIEKMVGVILS